MTTTENSLERRAMTDEVGLGARFGLLAAVAPRRVRDGERVLR